MNRENSLKVGIISGVVSTLLAAFIISYVPALTDLGKTILSSVWAIVTYNVPMPMWLVVILVALAMPIILKIVSKLAPKPEESWRTYKSDQINGIVWRWDYGYGSNRVTNLTPFCPNDDTVLIYCDAMNGNFDPQIVYSCETCKCNFRPLDGDLKFAKASILRQIDRKIRSGEWKLLVANRLTSQNDA